MKCVKLGELKGVPVFALSMEASSVYSSCDEYDLLQEFPDLFSYSILRLVYRSVSIDRWPLIQDSGVDVTPSDSVIYCNTLDKAMEYGGWPRVIMGFDWKCLNQTFREVDASIDAAELEVLTKTYPTLERSQDGTKIWLSRLSTDDPRRTSGYEISYARWIPGSPWQSLNLLILADLKERQWDVQLSIRST